MTKTCLTCQHEFWTAQTRQRYCTQRCWYRSDARKVALRKGQAKRADGRRQNKFAREITAAGFWFTPELLALCQSVYRRGYDCGRRSEENRLKRAS